MATKGKIDTDKFGMLMKTKVDDEKTVDHQPSPVNPVASEIRVENVIIKDPDADKVVEVKTVDPEDSSDEKKIIPAPGGKTIVNTIDEYMSVFKKNLSKKSGPQIRVSDKTHQIMTLLSCVENEDGQKVYIQDIMNNILDKWVVDNESNIKRTMKKMNPML